MSNPQGTVITTQIDHRVLSAARVYAAARYPYLASALFAMTVRPAPRSGTVAIGEQWQIHADPDVVKEFAPQELGRLFVHLLTHVLREHAARARRVGAVEEPASAAWWNRVADAEVNDDLAADAMVPGCAPDLPVTLGCAEGDLAEQYYRGARSAERHWDCGSGCDGVSRPWDDSVAGIGPRDAGWLRLATAAELQRCARAEPGTVPGGWLRWAETVLPSKTDWRRVLAAEIRAGIARTAGMVDYSYRRPSRRADGAFPVILPALERPLPDVAIVCDTSGSMSAGQLGQALIEIEALLERAGLRQANVRVLACDADVHVVRRVSRASQVELLGGGGTDMGEGIRRASLLRPRPSVVVVLTDGFTPWPDTPPRGLRVIVGLLEPEHRRPVPMSRAPAPSPSVPNDCADRREMRFAELAIVGRGSLRDAVALRVLAPYTATLDPLVYRE